LIFAPKAGASSEAVTLAIGPVMRVAADLAGEQYALEAARTLTAWANGFISMELAGSFQLGGDIERAYEFGIARLADALAGP
jgi:WHG domain-containing protein